MNRFWINIFLIIFTFPAYAQEIAQENPILQSPAQAPKHYILLENIVIEGNDKTQKSIILRELDLAIGDTIYLAKVDSILLRNKNKIFNTNLFVSVDLALEKPENQANAQLRVCLAERWYFFPVPIFELADRNFNEWVNTYKADFGRTNYGIRLVKENFRGRNEKIDFLLQFGFLKRFALNYQIPYIDRQQKYGLGFNLIYSENKSIAFQTNQHKLDFLESSSILRQRYEARVGLSKRNAYYTFHNLDLRFRNFQVADTVLQLNPFYFLKNKNTQKYFSLIYQFRRDVRDIQAYPLNGHLFSFRIEKNGLGIFNDVNNLNLGIGYSKYTNLGNRFYLENYLKGKALFLQRQAYADAQALGYGEDFMRGYELYVIDGQDFLINKNTLKFQLFNTKKRLRFMPIKQFKEIPFAGYLTAYGDFGYVKDKYFNETSNQLTNKFIFGYGLGFDTVTYYNLVLKFNYSFNSLGEGGFFFGISNDF